MKKFYQPLVDHFGEDELNKIMATKIQGDEDIGSYDFILRLYETAITDQEEKNKRSELKEKLSRVLN